MNSGVVTFFVLCVLGSTLAQLNGPNRAQTIGNIFQIPIQTLTAISNAAQNTRPLGQALQQRFRPQQQQQQQQPQLQQFASYFQTGNYISRAARIAGLYNALDGSGFRI